MLNKCLNAHTTHLINRAYKHRFIQEEINKVRLIPRSHALKTFTRQESDRVPFVVTFNPALPNINHIILAILTFFILHNDAKKNFLFILLYPTAVAIIYVKTSSEPNTADHPPKHVELSAVIKVGVRHVLLLQKEPRLTPSSLPTNNDASDTTTPVHLPIQCNKCNMQYIGETKRQLSDRFAEHRRSIEKASNQHRFYRPTAVSDHFSLPDRSIKDIELIPLELINSISGPRGMFNI